MNKTVILASSSPRRIDLLKYIIPEFKIIAPDIDELSIKSAKKTNLPKQIAIAKAKKVAITNPDAVILAFDTVVYCDDTIFNKPTNEDNAKFMLRQYSNKTHKVITGFCLIVDNKVYSYSSITKVTCSNISEDEISKYLSENEVYDKSGAYAIQSAFSCFVKSISGEFFNIMGLPLNLVATKIKEIVPSILN